MKNKKFMIFALVLLLTYSVFAAPEVKLWVDGEYVIGDVRPRILNNRTVVPIRQISEKLGIEPIWDEPTQTVTLVSDGLTVKFVIERNEYELNGQTYPMDTAAIILENRTFVPLRVVAEVFGKNVSWDAKNLTAIVGDGYIAPEVNEDTSEIEVANVSDVIDGDTIMVDINADKKKVRLVGVDSPEMSTPNGAPAKKFTTDNLLGKTVYLEKDVSDTDKYGRLLRYIWLVDKSNLEETNQNIEDYMYNAILVKAGHASSKRYAPDTKYQKIFDDLQDEALKKQIGMWAPTPVGAVVSSNKVEGWGLQFGTYVPENRTKVQVTSRGITYFVDTTKNVIKGNANSKKYHLPGMQGYDKISTVNVCFFRTEEEAIAHGFEKAKK